MYDPLFYDQSYFVSWHLTASSTSLDGSWTIELWHQSHGRVAQLGITSQYTQFLTLTTPAYYGDGFYIYVSGRDRTTQAPLTGRSSAFSIFPDMRCATMPDGGWVGDTKVAKPYAMKLYGLSDGLPLNITLANPDKSFVALLYSGLTASGETEYPNLPLPSGLSTGLYRITGSVQYRDIDDQLRTISRYTDYSMKSLASLKILSPGNGTTFEAAHVYALSFSYNETDQAAMTNYRMTLINADQSISWTLFSSLSLVSTDHWTVPIMLPIGQSDTFTAVLSPLALTVRKNRGMGEPHPNFDRLIFPRGENFRIFPRNVTSPLSVHPTHPTAGDEQHNPP
ncbi:hypothetical protein PAPYR_8277 [Paratrimastix pyriformis]|uniref:Uncharacterized protein n=1 Tax=Paratrimastix pyriformis TaxID=342808 RepID=A0ABQ8UDD6_9EUKA|nr:hypothetical protein PAPYR_8277 [Paratrimastix pyriformis]